MKSLKFLTAAMFFYSSLGLGIKASEWTESFLGKKFEQKEILKERPAEIYLENLSLKFWPKKDANILFFRYDLEGGMLEVTKQFSKLKPGDIDIKFQKKFKNSFFELTRKEEKGKKFEDIETEIGKAKLSITRQDKKIIKSFFLPFFKYSKQEGQGKELLTEEIFFEEGTLKHIYEKGKGEKELYELKIPNLVFFKTIKPEENYGVIYTEKEGIYEIAESEKGIMFGLNKQIGKAKLQLRHSQDKFEGHFESFGNSALEIVEKKEEKRIVVSNKQGAISLAEKDDTKIFDIANKNVAVEIKEGKEESIGITKKLENGSLELKLEDGNKEKIKYFEKFGNVKIGAEYKERINSATLETKIFDSNIKFLHKPGEQDVYGKIEKEFAGGKIAFAHEKVGEKATGEKEQLLAEFSKKFGKDEILISYKELPTKKEKERSGLKTEIKKYLSGNTFLTIIHSASEHEKIKKYNAGILSETSNYALGFKYGFAKPRLSMGQKNLGLNLKIKNINLELGADYFWQDNIEKGKLGIKAGMNFGF